MKKIKRVTLHVFISIFLTSMLILLGGCRNPINSPAGPHLVIVSFDTAGGTPVIESQTIPLGGMLQPVDPPRRSGFRFAGWYTDSAYTNEWDFDNGIVTEDITLYAKWTRAGGGGGGGSGGGGGGAPPVPPAPSTFSITLVRNVLTQHNAKDLNASEGTASVTVGSETLTVSSSASTITFNGIEAGETVTLEALASALVTTSWYPHEPLSGAQTLPLAELRERAVFINWDVPSGLTFNTGSDIDMNASFDMPASNLTITANFYPDLFVLQWNLDEINRFHPNLINNGHPTDFKIPASINGNIVTRIGRHAFDDSIFQFDEPKLTNVQFSHELQLINDWAFAYQGLVNVVIPNSVLAITGYAFLEAFAAAGGTLSFEEGGNMPLYLMGDAFTNSTISELVIPPRVEYVDDRVFFGNPLTKITILPRGTQINFLEGAYHFGAFPDWDSFETAFNGAGPFGVGVYTRVGSTWSWSAYTP